MLLPTLDFAFIVKIFFLFIIAVYAAFVLVVFINIRSLDKLILVKSSSGSKVVTALTLIYLLSTIFLFILAVVIL